MGVVMNKEVYGQLPTDIQAIIDDMFYKYSLEAGKGIDEDSALGENLFIEQGGQYYEWNPEALDEIDKRFAPIWDKWIADNEAKGVPAKQAINDFYSLMKEQGIERPAYGYTPGG